MNFFEARALQKHPYFYQYWPSKLWHISVVMWAQINTIIQLSHDVSQFSIPIEDETALLVTLQTLGETVEEYETLVKLRCPNLDKQKEEALILILKRKAELLRDISRVKKDVDENQKEIAFFEDPVAFENERQATKQKELKKTIQKFNRSPKKGLQLLLENKQIHDDTKVLLYCLEKM